jgi:pimeloyl-ACP methyl ester carboxylesterase
MIKLLIAAIFCFLCPGIIAQNIDSIIKYDESLPFRFTVVSDSSAEKYSVKQITIDVTSDQKMSAFMMTRSPNSSTVIFVHWGGGTKEYFRDEAHWYVSQGYNCILLDAPWLWPTYDSTLDRFRSYPDMIHLNIKAVGRLLDYLEKEQFNNQKFYVGHSYGGTLGGLLAGIEPRINGFVLMAGLPSISKSIIEDPFGFWKKEKQQRPLLVDSVVKQLSVMEPEDFIGKTSAMIFHQFASNDQYVSKDQSLYFIKKTKVKHRVKWYNTNHEFLNYEAKKDRLIWFHTIRKRKK